MTTQSTAKPFASTSIAPAVEGPDASSLARPGPDDSGQGPFPPSPPPSRKCAIATVADSWGSLAGKGAGEAGLDLRPRKKSPILSSPDFAICPVGWGWEGGPATRNDTRIPDSSDRDKSSQASAPSTMALTTTVQQAKGQRLSVPTQRIQV